MDLHALERVASLDFGDVGMRPSAGGADDCRRGKPALVGRNFKVIAGPLDTDHPDRTLDRELVSRLIAAKIIENIVAGWISFMGGRGHQPARQ